MTSFIATLASLGIVTGIAYVITNGYNIADVPLSLQSDFGVAKLGGVVPYPALIALVVALGASFLLYRTRFGLHTLALGSSREAAIRAGVRVRGEAYHAFHARRRAVPGSAASSISGATRRPTSAATRPTRWLRSPVP